MYILDFIGWLLNYVALDEIKCLCSFTKKYNTQKFITKPQSKSMSWSWLHLVHLIWNAKKPNEKRLRVAFDHGQCPLIPFRIFVHHVTILNSSFMQHLRWSSLCQKIGNGWKLLLTVVTENFVLNETGLLNLTLKLIDKFIPSGI